VFGFLSKIESHPSIITFKPQSELDVAIASHVADLGISVVASVQVGCIVELAHSQCLSAAIGLMDPEMAAAASLASTSSTGSAPRRPHLQRMGLPVFVSLVELSGAGWAMGTKVHPNLDRSVADMTASAFSTGSLSTATVNCWHYDTRMLSPCGSKVLIKKYVPH
jgi:hypothetical protein